MGLPEQASSFALAVDLLFYATLFLSVLFTVLVAVPLGIFAIRYRRRSADEVPVQIEGALKLEELWIAIPMVLSIFVFGWAAYLYVQMSSPPDDSMEVFVVGRQWMWKAQHPTGQWENNELHVPVGKPVKLTMTSHDVIHDFYVPEFRNKQDVVPGRYTQMWFTATKPGVYRLFCAEYCGTQHSGMIGTVTAMSVPEYELWLSGATTQESPAAAGQRHFQDLGCESCHQPTGQGRAPSLVGIYGQTEQLEGGATVTVDDAYLRESILNPRAKVVEGYRPIMPAYQGQISEETLLQLIAYIKSGGERPDGATGPRTDGGQGTGGTGTGGTGTGGSGGGERGNGAPSQPTVESGSGGGNGGRGSGAPSQPTVESSR